MSITLERLREVLHYDPLTGIFTWRVKQGRNGPGKRAGSVKKDGYRDIGIDGKTYREHRLAWMYMEGEFPELDIDHKNRVQADNRFSNLRPATVSENGQNRTAKGVTFHKQTRKWQAQIRVDGKHIYIGLFPDEKLAINAYLDKKAELHPFFNEVIAEEAS
jgi:hypothetical protein